MGLLGACKLFVRALTDSEFESRATQLLLPPKETKTQNGDVLRLLALLQRDGRLVDFLLESIDSYTDEQIGAAVRDIHRDCRKVLEKYLVLEPVMDEEEDSIVKVEEGFNPTEISLVGNVKGSAPYQGTLLHRGWLVAEVNLPKDHTASERLILAPAEVEIS